MPATRGKPTMLPKKFVSVTNRYDESFWEDLAYFAKKNGIPSVPFYISFVMHQYIAEEKMKEIRDRKAGLADV